MGASVAAQLRGDWKPWGQKSQAYSFIATSQENSLERATLMPVRVQDRAQWSSTRLHILRAPCRFRFRSHFQSINALGTPRHVQPQQLAAFTFNFRQENLEHKGLSSQCKYCHLILSSGLETGFQLHLETKRSCYSL